MVPIEVEIKNTREVVLRDVERAIDAALSGMAHEVTVETATLNDSINPEIIRSLEKWAKKMYLHFPKETASNIIDFADEVYDGMDRVVKNMVQRSVYHAIAAHSKTTIAKCPEVKEEICQMTCNILLDLCKQEDISSIAAMHMAAALYRANDLTLLYLEKRCKDMLREASLRLMSPSALTKEMDQFHENAMNYFYRQALTLLQKEEENAKLRVKKECRVAYKKLIHETHFREEIKAWLRNVIFPKTEHATKSLRPVPQRSMAQF